MTTARPQGESCRRADFLQPKPSHPYHRVHRMMKAKRRVSHLCSNCVGVMVNDSMGAAAEAVLER
jgi:hypothetical protein